MCIYHVPFRRASDTLIYYAWKQKYTLAGNVKFNFHSSFKPYKVSHRGPPHGMFGTESRSYRHILISPNRLTATETVTMATQMHWQRGSVACWGLRYGHLPGFLGEALLPLAYSFAGNGPPANSVAPCICCVLTGIKYPFPKSFISKGQKKFCSWNYTLCFSEVNDLF